MKGREGEEKEREMREEGGERELEEIRENICLYSIIRLIKSKYTLLCLWFNLDKFKQEVK